MYTYFQRYLHFVALCYLQRNVVHFCWNLVFLSSFRALSCPSQGIWLTFVFLRDK